MTSRRHQRRAALPGAGYTRPSSRDPTGLIVTVFGESGGVEGTFDFTTCPAASSCDARSPRHWIAGPDLQGPGAPGRPAATGTGPCARSWSMWWPATTHPPRRPRSARRYGLNGDCRCRTTILPAIGWLCCGRSCRWSTGCRRRRSPRSTGGSRRARNPTEVAYPYDRFEQIRSTAAATFNTALVRIRSNREHLRRWYAGEYAAGSTDWVIGEALDAILRTGDVPRRGRGCDMLHRHARVLGGRGADKTWATAVPDRSGGVRSRGAAGGQRGLEPQRAAPDGVSPAMTRPSVTTSSTSIWWRSTSDAGRSGCATPAITSSTPAPTVPDG